MEESNQHFYNFQNLQEAQNLKSWPDWFRALSIFFIRKTGTPFYNEDIFRNKRLIFNSLKRPVSL